MRPGLGGMGTRLRHRYDSSLCDFFFFFFFFFFGLNPACLRSPLSTPLSPCRAVVSMLYCSIFLFLLFLADWCTFDGVVLVLYPKWDPRSGARDAEEWRQSIEVGGVVWCGVVWCVVVCCGVVVVVLWWDVAAVHRGGRGAHML